MTCSSQLGNSVGQCPGVSVSTMQQMNILWSGDNLGPASAERPKPQARQGWSNAPGLSLAGQWVDWWSHTVQHCRWLTGSYTIDRTNIHDRSIKCDLISLPFVRCKNPSWGRHAEAHLCTHAHTNTCRCTEHMHAHVSAYQVWVDIAILH